VGDKRKRARVRGRYRVDFESGGRRGTGVTANLSDTGMHLSSVVVFLPGTRLGGVVRLPTGEDAAFQAEVRWAKKLRGPDALATQNSMGIEFTELPAATYSDFIRARMTPEAGSEGDEGSWAGAAPLAPRIAVTLAAPSATPLPAWNRVDVTRPGRLRIGLDGLSSLTLGHADLVGPSRPNECSLSLGRAVGLVEEATLRAVDGFLPEAHRLVPRQVELTLVDWATLPQGTTLAAACKLTSLGSDGRTLVFDASISGLRREVGRARIACVLVPW
jgi:hypothetical protein